MIWRTECGRVLALARVLMRRGGGLRRRVRGDAVRGDAVRGAVAARDGGGAGL